jgi:hypothetical protein
LFPATLVVPVRLLNPETWHKVQKKSYLHPTFYNNSGQMTNLAENGKITGMETDKNRKAEKKKGFVDGITDKLVDKAEELIDDTTDKIYKSEPYQKAGKSMEKATLSIFRKVGKWWGKL